jgi:SAM-dependent methyltransferase
MTDDYKDRLKAALLDEAAFVKATFTGVQRGQDMRWRKLVIRPVMLNAGRHLQFSYLDDKQDFTQNFAEDDLAEQIDNALDLPFKHYHIYTVNGELQVQISKKGKPLVGESKSNDVSPRLTLAHDREKRTILSTDSSRDYLQATGIMTADGDIKASMQSKFKQINHFLELVEGSGGLDQFKEAINVVDCGCGNAYLTFAMYHYLHDLRGLRTQLTGIDVNTRLMRRHAENTQRLGWDGLDFQTSAIIDYQPETPPDMVVALHACDTATDDAIAQGIRWGSKVIICAPCCHHDLQAQLSQSPAPSPFASIMRHGVLFERMGDILTDSFRALILRILGYRADVVQFVDSEHTPKNLMIRAVKTDAPADPRFLDEYRELKTLWSVTPYLETLIELGE